MKYFNIDLAAIKSFSFKSVTLPFNLQRREQIALICAGVVVGVFVVLQVMVFPLIDRRTRLHDQIKSQKEALIEMQAIQTEYTAISRNTQDMENQLKRRPDTFTLFSFIDQLAGKSGIKQNIASMKPSTANLKNSPYGLSTVEMKINALTMDQLAPFLHGVENNSRMVWIKRLSISKGSKNESLLDVVLQVATLQR
jgi:general secretion pathway protein M